MATATPIPLPSELRTAPLPAPALAALARLESALPSTEAVARAVSRYRSAKARLVELDAVNARDWSGADFLALGDAQASVKASRDLLAAAGLLHLIGGA